MKPKGEVTVDAGAVTALAQGKSLLPAGVRAVGGSFGRGAPVRGGVSAKSGGMTSGA